ncbi:cell cycle checkpoint protein RAD17 [Coffea eugenioides]|uniref:cell cycle checkpoint protein RAD17 n=1 Tax=Coffea eugenioides TaxID=49369 RepID=UPI000F60AE82|nr:cell cycle checkpoint protein RAD17 [Coffea eugenioides]
MKGRGKRNATIVISSSEDDDDDKDFSLKSDLSYSKPASVPPTNPNKRAKKASLSKSGPRPRKGPLTNDFDEIRRFCEEFDDGIKGFKVSTGNGMSRELWVDKYKPCSLEELAVHKKKVEEVKVLFEERLTASKETLCKNVLLFVGPAGVGKSATVYAIASHFGATISEWNTPTPTIWQEHLYNSSSGLRYTSKLEEFESFVERIRKYGFISSTVGPRSRVVLLIDDLPVVNGKVSYGRLHRCLHLLVQSVCVPTVILMTDYVKADSTDNSMRYWEDLHVSLQEAGACKVSFNPITVNSLKKTLSRICKEEECELSAEQIELLAKASGGDIRHAITSLQYFCLKPHQLPSLCLSDGSTPSLRERTDGLTDLYIEPSLSFGRDDTLSLFHALGKFLHNKRESEPSMVLDRDTTNLKEKFVRLPLKMDSPESILRQAHSQSRPIADFLHENVLDFVNDEAIDDAWVVASYLSDSDVLLASVNGRMARNFEAENVVQSAAASVAVRGVLFGNSHLAPTRWHAIRRPKLWQVEQSLWHYKRQMVSQQRDANNGLNLYDLSVVATEIKPALKRIGNKASEDFEAHEASPEHMADDLDGLILDDKSEMTSEDEIEDW